MADTPDSLAATLDEIKERAKAAAELNVDLIAQFVGPDTKSIAGWIAASALDVPTLLAALDAVLKLHEPDPADPSWCGDCTFAWPCSTYRAITAELTKGVTL